MNEDQFINQYFKESQRWEKQGEKAVRDIICDSKVLIFLTTHLLKFKDKKL